MSRENVETVRRAVDLFNRREISVEYLDPDVEWIEDQRYPGAQTYHGRDGVQRSIEKWWDAWSAVTMQVKDFVDAGDLVVYWGVSEARGQDSDVTVSAPFGAVWEFRDGMVVRVQVLGGRDQALEAAGLADERDPA
jgi:ketosteroid isomerase-like protein